MAISLLPRLSMIMNFVYLSVCLSTHLFLKAVLLIEKIFPNTTHYHYHYLLSEILSILLSHYVSKLFNQMFLLLHRAHNKLSFGVVDIHLLPITIWDYGSRPPKLPIFRPHKHNFPFSLTSGNRHPKLRSRNLQFPSTRYN